MSALNPAKFILLGNLFFVTFSIFYCELHSKLTDFELFRGSKSDRIENMIFHSQYQLHRQDYEDNFEKYRGTALNNYWINQCALSNEDNE